MKVVFLDFDGVLNGGEHFRRMSEAGNADGHRKESDSLDPQNVERLNRIIAATGADVVISSSWRVGRTLNRLRKVLGEVGFLGRVVGMTPSVPFAQRGDEIARWLRYHRNVETYVVLDDDNDMDAVRARFIRTSFHRGGLLDEHAELAIAMLNAPLAIPIAVEVAV